MIASVFNFMTADEAVNMWYEQINFHDFDEEFTYETSYFTQLVWKSTNLVGFGRAIATDGTAAYVVAHFKPKGNVRGLFNANVPFARPSSAISTDLLNRRSEANSVVSHREETKKEKKEREKAEKEERKRLEKLRKEREKMEKKAQKEREKQEKLEKKEQRKSLKSEVKLR